jgi:hypothetical protein
MGSGPHAEGADQQGYHQPQPQAKPCFLSPVLSQKFEDLFYFQTAQHQVPALDRLDSH